MINNIKTFVIFSKDEKNRQPHLNILKTQISELIIIDAIYPDKVKIPFLSKIISKSKERTGKALLSTEVGVILSHRKIWKEIVKKSINNEHYLILESDSKIIDQDIIKDNIDHIKDSYDIFFWGAWNGYVSLKSSKTQNISKFIKVGEPLVKSIYGAYGYSLNSKCARYLLEKTKKISYPVDLYKYYFKDYEIKIGAIKPEVIKTWLKTKSSIRKENLLSKIKKKVIINIFYIRNNIISYFN